MSDQELSAAQYWPHTDIKYDRAYVTCYSSIGITFVYNFTQYGRDYVYIVYVPNNECTKVYSGSCSSIKKDHYQNVLSADTIFDIIRIAHYSGNLKLHISADQTFTEFKVDGTDIDIPLSFNPTLVHPAEKRRREELLLKKKKLYEELNEIDEELGRSERSDYKI